MTMADTPGGSEGLQGQILLELGKLSTSVAVIDERTKQIDTISTRLREVELAQAQNTGGRDAHARIVSWGAVAAAIGSAVAAYLHH